MILTQNVSKQTHWFQSLMVILSKFKSCAPSADSRSAVCMLTSQFTAGCSRGSAVWGEALESGRGLQKMTNKWHIHTGRGRSNSESNGLFSSTHTQQLHTKNREPREQTLVISVVSPCPLCVIPHSSLAPVFVLFHHSHWIFPDLNARAIIPIIISQCSRALCKPQPRFSCL